MNITVQFGDGINYRGDTTAWFLCPFDNWTVEQLRADLRIAAKPCPPVRLLVGNGELGDGSLCAEVLNDGDVVSVEIA